MPGSRKKEALAELRHLAERASKLDDFARIVRRLVQQAAGPLPQGSQKQVELRAGR